jgi:hypothetical protein
MGKQGEKGMLAYKNFGIGPASSFRTCTFASVVGQRKGPKLHHEWVPESSGTPDTAPELVGVLSLLLLAGS